MVTVVTTHPRATPPYWRLRRIFQPDCSSRRHGLLATARDTGSLCNCCLRQRATGPRALCLPADRTTRGPGGCGLAGRRGLAGGRGHDEGRGFALPGGWGWSGDEGAPSLSVCLGSCYYGYCVSTRTSCIHPFSIQVDQIIYRDVEKRCRICFKFKSRFQ